MPVQKVCLRASLFAVGLLVASSAFAQETPSLFDADEPASSSSETSQTSSQSTSSTSTSTSSTSAKTAESSSTLKMSLSFVDDIAIGEDLQVRARITDTDIGTKELRDTVVLLGTVSTGTSVDGLVPSAITWSQVIRTDTSASKQLSDQLESRFRISESSPTVSANETVYAEGDVDGMIAAAMDLLADASNVTDKTEASSSSGSEGDANNFKTASSNDSGNSAFDDITIPEPKEETKLAAAEDVVTQSTMGCEIDVDLEAGVARVQEQDLINGNPQGNCAPNGTNYPLSPSYAGCADIVDMEAKKAWAAYKRFYVDGGGTNQTVDTECLKDTELEYTIFQKPDECTREVDLVNSMVYERGKWVYQSKNITSAWNEIEVTGCERMEAEGAALNTTDQGCTPRHDFDAGISFQQTKLYYIEDGQHKFVSDCTDSGLTYTHSLNKQYCDDLAPTKAQLSLTDATRAVYKQSRKEISIDGEMVAITQCAPDSATATDAYQDPIGCESTFFHYLSSGQSYGSGRWKYKFDGEPEVVLTECLQDDDIEYTHQVRIADYANNDDVLISKPKTEIYIASSAGEVIVSQAQVREGAPEIPYTFVQDMQVSTGEIFFEDDSCDKWMRRTQVKRYLRGDGTSTFDRVMGDAEALNQGNDCVTSVVWDEDNATFSRSSSTFKKKVWECRETSGGTECGDKDVTWWRCYSRRHTKATYSIVRQFDGLVITSAEETGTATNGNERDAPCGYPGYPSSISGSSRANYEASWWGI